MFYIPAAHKAINGSDGHNLTEIKLLIAGLIDDFQVFFSSSDNYVMRIDCEQDFQLRISCLTEIF